MRYAIDGSHGLTLAEVLRAAPPGRQLGAVLERDLPTLRAGDRVLVCTRAGDVAIDALGEPLGEPVGEPLPEWARRSW